MESTILLDPSTEGLELKNAPYQQSNQLVQVSIEYSDLIGMDNESITLFADTTTTAKQVAEYCNPLSSITNAHCIYVGTSSAGQFQDSGVTSLRCIHGYRAVKRKRWCRSCSVWCLRVTK